jgi:LPS export ABC transporter permease LptG/LPS export ABC transporter permease LptF
MKTLDRYLIRETIGPFALALALFTFLLWVQPMLKTAEVLIAKGAPMETIAYLLVTLLPQALGVTVPMAFLAGVVMALGRFSADREAVAMMACGVSPVRLIRPVLILGSLAAAATLYVLIWLMPDANQSFRDVTFQLTRKMATEDVKPGEFYEGFTGKAILIGGRENDGAWTQVMIADTTADGGPSIQLAGKARLVADEGARLVNIILTDVTSYRRLKDESDYEVQQSTEEVAHIDPKSVFGDGASPGRGFNEMTIAQLDAQAAEKMAAGISPHNEIMFKQQRFAFPLACLVFAVMGVALGVTTRKDGKLAGFAIGIVVIMAYYGIMTFFEGQAKGNHFPALWARWMPNIILGVIGLGLLWWRSQGARRVPELSIPGWLSAWWPGTAGARSGATGQPRIVLVIRYPVFSWPRPRLMDLYVSRRYVRTAVLAFTGLLALYYIGEFIEMSEKVSKGNATMAMLAEYFYYATPRFIYVVIPLATLVAVLTTLGGLTRTNELTVLRACGTSLYRTALPMIVLALCMSGVLFALEDRVVAQSERRAEVLRNTIRDRPQRTFNAANRSWSIKDGTFYHYAVFDVRRQTLQQLSVFETASEPYRMKSHTFARTASFADGKWIARDGWVRTLDDAGRVRRSVFKERPLELQDQEPADFGTEQVDAAFMSYQELRAYINRLDRSGFSVAEQKVELERKIAFPFVTLVMTLIAIPLGVTTGRRGALYGIGLAIVLAVAYLLTSSLFIAFGSATLLPAALAAWATNILFAAAALMMLFTVRT